MLAHDWLCGLRGGEHVLDRMARCLAGEFEIAALLVMFDDHRPLTGAIDAMPKVVSMVGRLPLASTQLRRWMLPLYPAAVGDLSRRLARLHAEKPVSMVISTSSAAIKGLRPPAGVPHLCYVHSPARYVWGQTAQYAGGLRGLGLALAREPYMAWDLETAANVTKFLANSTHTAAEVRRCFARDAEVVWPPVRTEFFRPGAGSGDEARPFWLVVCALEPYKRVDVAIAAANRAAQPLVILGDGSDRRRLERLAGPTVVFRGRVSDEDLLTHYRTARLLVFPQVEDFGIVAAEAISCGCPVVARHAGGAIDIVEEGITGAFFDGATPEALLDAVTRCPAPNPAQIAGHAQRFAEDRFDREFMRAVRSLRAG